MKRKSIASSSSPHKREIDATTSALSTPITSPDPAEKKAKKIPTVVATTDSNVTEYLGLENLVCIAGDINTWYLTGYLRDETLFDKIMKDAEKHWLQPEYRGNKMLRAKVAYSAMEVVNGVLMVPEYKYPSSKQVVERPLTPLILSLREQLRVSAPDLLPNHAIATYYGFDRAAISAHSDKHENFVEGAPILTYSFGHSRELELVNKKTGQVIRILVQPNSLYSLGYKFNQEWTHSILKGNKMSGPRISIVFRTLKKWVPHPNQSLLSSVRLSTPLPLTSTLDTEMEELQAMPFDDAAVEEEEEDERVIPMAVCDFCHPETRIAFPDYDDVHCLDCGSVMCEAHDGIRCNKCNEEQRICMSCQPTHVCLPA